MVTKDQQQAKLLLEQEVIDRGFEPGCVIERSQEMVNKIGAQNTVVQITNFEASLHISDTCDTVSLNGTTIYKNGEWANIVEKYEVRKYVPKENSKGKSKDDLQKEISLLKVQIKNITKDLDQLKSETKRYRCFLPPMGW